jgi:hypothetical protein
VLIAGIATSSVGAATNIGRRTDFFICNNLSVSYLWLLVESDKARIYIYLFFLSGTSLVEKIINSRWETNHNSLISRYRTGAQYRAAVYVLSVLPTVTWIILRPKKKLIISQVNTRFDRLTINVPLFKKLRDIIFFCGTITYWAISRDILRGPTFLTP